MERTISEASYLKLFNVFPVPGAHGVFIVTEVSWTDEPIETEQGKRAIDSAIKNGLQHIVYSGLESAKTVTGHDVYHFDFKKDVEDYGFAQNAKINFSSVRLPFYFENYLFYNMLHKIGDKQFVWSTPMSPNARLYGFSVEDLGKFNFDVGCKSNISD